MLGIGFGEMILIAGIALMVFGPEKFPDFAKIVLRTVNDLRGYVDEIQKEVTKEIRPIKRELEQMSKYDPEKYIDALSKDVKNAVEKKEEKTVSSDTKSSESAAESTDVADAPAKDPYMEAGMDTDLREDGYDNAESSSETGENQDCRTDAGDTDDGDDLDFSEPPVERLD